MDNSLFKMLYIIHVAIIVKAYIVRLYDCVYLQEVQAVADACSTVSVTYCGDWDGIYTHAAGHDLQWLDLSQCVCWDWCGLLHIHTFPYF